MTAHAVRSSADVAQFGATIRRELDAARAELARRVEIRADAESALAQARAAEETARRALSALEVVARQAADVLPDLADEVATSELPNAEQHTTLAGAELREMIARVGLRNQRQGKPVHWREWHGWLRQAGFDAGGKRAAATFQTQLARSPLVRRADEEGHYVLDLGRLDVERDNLRRLHAQLAQLPPPDQLALLGDHREQRRQIQAEIARAERVIDEIWRVLSREHPPRFSAGPEVSPEQSVRAWLSLNGEPARF